MNCTLIIGAGIKNTQHKMTSVQLALRLFCFIIFNYHTIPLIFLCHYCAEKLNLGQFEDRAVKGGTAWLKRPEQPDHSLVQHLDLSHIS